MLSQARRLEWSERVSARVDSLGQVVAKRPMVFFGRHTPGFRRAGQVRGFGRFDSLRR